MAEKTVKIQVEVPTSNVEIDPAGHVIIKDPEFAKKVDEFLSSSQGNNFTTAEYFLLCCTL
jgi:hypothetical protein